MKNSADHNFAIRGFIEDDVLAFLDTAKPRSESITRASRFRRLSDETTAFIESIAVFPRLLDAPGIERIRGDVQQVFQSLLR